MLDDDQHLTKIVNVAQMPRIGMHGTRKQHVAQILAKRLKPGGRRGLDHRAHVHLVECIEASGETAGVRGGSDCVVHVDMHLLIQNGADVVVGKANCSSQAVCGNAAIELLVALTLLRDLSWTAWT